MKSNLIIQGVPKTLDPKSAPIFKSLVNVMHTIFTYLESVISFLKRKTPSNSVKKWQSYSYFRKMASFSFYPRIGYMYVKDIRNGWMSMPQCLFLHLLRPEFRKRGDMTYFQFILIYFNWVKCNFFMETSAFVFALIFFWERNKIKNGISILPRIFVGSKSLLILFMLLSFISFPFFHTDTNQTSV